MSKNLTTDFYEISKDINRLLPQDFRYDLEVSQDVLESIFFDNAIYEIEPLNLPNPIICEAEPGFIQYVDYAHTNFFTSGVMTKRMLKVLQSVKPFDCRVYPIKAVDFVTFPIRNLAPNNDFVAVQLTEYLDVFDYENSVYEKYIYFDEITGEEKSYPIEKMVLKKPKEGYPPIFRIKEKGVLLYISDEARQALKKANITGVEYFSSDGYRYTDGYNYEEFTSEIDVPLIMPDWDTREKEWRAKTG